MVHASGHARSWGAYVATGIVVGLLLSGQAHSKQGDAEVAHGDHPHAAQAPTQPVTPEKPKPYQSPTRCERPENAEQDNLCIERRSAKASEDQAYWAHSTFWIGVGGTTGVVLTLFATAWAAWAGQRSAKAAEDAVSKSENLLSHSEDTAQRQLRAYITVDEGRLFNVGTGNKWYAEIKIINGGTTPAYDVEISSSIRGNNFPTAEVLEIPNYISGGKNIMGPSGVVIIQPTLLDEPTTEMTNRLMTGKAIIYVTGLVTYRDVFGDEQWTTFRYFAGGNVPFGPTGGLAPYDFGNDAS